MLDTSTSVDLRKHVRSVIAVDHDRVNARFAALDIQTRSGLAMYLQAHRAAFHAILLSGSPFEGRISEFHLKDTVKALDTDLKSLRVPVHAIRQHRTDYASHAVDHIVLGSRFGSASVRSRWLMSDDRQVRQARAYFAQPPVKDEWRAHCMELSRMDATDDDGSVLVNDARRLYALFDQALDVCG